jgi:archaeosine-15-forming tRNA-guanine transglycosylase
MSEQDMAEVLDRAERDWASLADSPFVRQYIALVDGEPVATGRATSTAAGVLLNGGSTVERARGRGAYRALVVARWADAVAQGKPVLVTQAGAMSRPILAGLGFREVCDIRILLDKGASGPVDG